MKPRFRSPSLFWTFAGSFLAVLIATAILQVLLVVLVLRPITAHWARTRAELLTRQVANRLAELPAPPSDEDIQSVLRSFQSAESEEMPFFVGSDGRIVSGMRPLPPMLRRFEQPTGDVLGTFPEKPDDKGAMRGDRRRRWPEGTPGRAGGPPEALSRNPVETAEGTIGEVVAFARPKASFMWPRGIPRPILVFLPVAVLMAGAAGLIIFRVLLRRLHALEGLATRVTEGDLEARVPEPGSDEIGRLGAKMNRMTETLAAAMRRIEESDHGRRRLLADISHELATPLTSIRGYAETLLDPSVPVSEEERVGYLQNVLEESKRMDLLIDDLLDLTRLEAGAETLSKVRLDLTELSRNVLNRFQTRFRQAGLEVKWSGPAEQTWVFANGRRIEYVVENLLVNALRYVPPGGKVTLSIEYIPGVGTAGEGGRLQRDKKEQGLCEADAGSYSLTVSDDGPGFPSEDLPHVFDRFYRADAARSTGGSGLGLAIVKEIVRLHRGEVRAENRKPSGASIHIILPASL